MIKNKGQIIKNIQSKFLKKNMTPFFVGDSIQVHFKIKEGKRERIQIFEGIVISIRGEGISKSFIVRKMSSNIGVEKIFPIHSPKIEKIKIVKRGKVRRAKLYYLRNRLGKMFQVKRLSREEEKILEAKLLKT